MSKLTDMSLTPEEGKEESFEVKEMAKPKYPWGLTFSLDDVALKKLGIDELPKVDEEMLMTCVVRVSGVNQSEDQQAERKNVQLQICEMGLMPYVENPLKKTAKRIYGG